VPSLPKTLGKTFYGTPKTIPIPVKVTTKTAREVVEQAFGKTYVRKSSGNCCAVRVGTLGMSVEELVENCVAVWERGVEARKLVKQGVKGMRSLFVKSAASVALPVWVTEELYSEEDVLLPGDIPVKEIKTKAERKLLKQSKSQQEVVEKKKRTAEDDVETSFEERRSRKLAKKSLPENPKKQITA